MKNSNQLHGHQRPVKEGPERRLDAVSIDRRDLVREAVPTIDGSMGREFGLDGNTPTVAVTAEEQESFRALMRQMDAEYRAAISGGQLAVPQEAGSFEQSMHQMDPAFQEAVSGDQLTQPAVEPGYAQNAEALGVQTQHLGREAVRSLQQEAPTDFPNNGINPVYLSPQGELENA